MNKFYILLIYNDFSSSIACLSKNKECCKKKALEMLKEFLDNDVIDKKTYKKLCKEENEFIIDNDDYIKLNIVETTEQE